MYLHFISQCHYLSWCLLCSLFYFMFGITFFFHHFTFAAKIKWNDEHFFYLLFSSYYYHPPSFCSPCHLSSTYIICTLFIIAIPWLIYFSVYTIHFIFIIIRRQFCLLCLCDGRRAAVTAAAVTTAHGTANKNGKVNKIERCSTAKWK